MQGWTRLIFLGALFPVFLSTRAFAVGPSNPVLTKAEQLFGPALKTYNSVLAFRFNDRYVLWLIFEGQGSLSEVDVGPKSYYASEFPGTKESKEGEYLSPAEYEDALLKISQLKDIGGLQEPHRAAVPTNFGMVNTDRFEHVFVDRVVTQGGDENVVKFNVYFLQEIQGSAEQVKTDDEQSMVCLGGLWYYIAPEAVKTIRLGLWGSLLIAGPNLREHVGCNRTTTVYDADGFTIENPQNETIVFHDLAVRALSGRVHSYGGDPVESVNVEVLLVGDGLRGPRASPRRKSISGFVILDHKARTSV